MIRAQLLTLARGSRALIQDATFDIPPGARVGVVGRNGSGKSSLFAAVAGDLTPDARRVAGARPVDAGQRRPAHAAESSTALAYALAGDEDLALLRAALAARRNSTATATIWRIWPKRWITPATGMPRRARRNCCAAWASPTPIWRVVSTSSPAVGACVWRWRAP